VVREPVVWRGHHGDEFRALFERCWDEGTLLIACPPAAVDEACLALARETLAAPEAPVLGVFTTGTTRATPRLVLYSRRNLEASQGSIFALFDASQVDTIFCYPQPYHVFGLLLGYALSKLRSLELVTGHGPYGKSHHERWLAVDSGRTLTLATPTHIVDLCVYLSEQRARPRPTYSAILGGARVDRHVWRLARDRAEITAPSVGYGCTEASPGICHLPPGVEPAVDGDVGWPLAHAALTFPEGGCFVLTGPGVAMATIEAGRLTYPSEHCGGDELVRHTGGRLAFGGRRDLILNRGGEKFQLEAIETVLRERHGLEAICVEVPDHRLGGELGIVARAGASRGPVYETLAEVFGRRFDPTRYCDVQALPLDANAKPDRRAAAALLET
jgi:acyl-CoA synthetase (AMP-forming)/AMP-acid ligase II